MRQRQILTVVVVDAARSANWLNTSTGAVAAYKFDESGNLQL